MTVAGAKAVADLAKTILESVAIGFGALAIFKWFRERSDRATDVLLQLEKDFTTQCAVGRELIEDRREYARVANAIRLCLDDRGVDLARWQAELLGEIDTVLRFYVVLAGLREARQVPDSSLSASYRFWLAHYYHKERVELREYINTYFPTLREWLLRDLDRQRRFDNQPFGDWWRSFFRPDDFWIEDEIERNPAVLFSREDWARVRRDRIGNLG